MTLPVTITGISTATAPVGPFKVAAATYTVANVETTTETGNGTSGSTTANFGQTITTVGAFSLAQADWYLSANSALAAPSTAFVEVRSGSFTGTLLGTSDTVDLFAQALPITFKRVPFTFSTLPALSAATQYYFILKASTTTNPVLANGNSTNTYAGGTAYTPTSGTPTTARTGAPFDYRVTLYESQARPDAYYFIGASQAAYCPWTYASSPQLSRAV